MTTPNEITPIEPVLDTPVAQEPVAYIRVIPYDDKGNVQRDVIEASKVGDLSQYADFVEFIPLYASPVAARAQPTWDDLQALAVKHGAWVPGYGPFAAELLATYGLAPAAQPHWVMNWLNAMNAVGGQAQLMATCPTCGNKRCPHAQDQQNACTGSNEPGQPVSGADGLLARLKKMLSDGPFDLRDSPKSFLKNVQDMLENWDSEITAQPQPSGNAEELPDEVRVPLDSLYADAGYLIGRLNDGSLTPDGVVAVIRSCIDEARAALAAQGGTK